jgi:hypothetical protein
MNAQQIITIGIVAVAAYFLGRHVWGELEGLFRSSKAGHCASCGMCEAGTKGRAAPEIKTVPLVTLQPALPPHLEAIRARQAEARERADGAPADELASRTP